MTATAPKPTPPTETPKRAISTGVLAGRLYERLRAWSAECDAEVKTSPDEIRAKWKKKIAAEIDKADPFVRELVEKMMKSDGESGKKAAAE